MRPKSLQLTATASAQNVQVGPALKTLVITNEGPADAYVDFDNEVTTSAGYKIPAGGSLSGEFNFIRFYYMTGGGTAKLYLIKVLQ